MAKRIKANELSLANTNVPKTYMSLEQIDSTIMEYIQDYVGLTYIDNNTSYEVPVY